MVYIVTGDFLTTPIAGRTCVRINQRVPISTRDVVNTARLNNPVVDRKINTIPDSGVIGDVERRLVLR